MKLLTERSATNARRTWKFLLAASLLLTGSSRAFADQPWWSWGNGNNRPEGPAVVASNQFFDYNIPPQSSPQFVPSPFLTDANAAAVDAFLKSQPSGSVIAVKVDRPISNTTASTIFNSPDYRVGYVLADLENATAAADAARLSQQVRFLSNGTQTRSFDAYVGNFGFAPLPNDPTRPANYSSKFGQHSWSGFSKNDYQSAGLTMANEELYPGSPSFRNPASGDSSAPNIRSALFTLPVLRESYVTQNLDSAHAHVPWITNFNNWGNTALNSPGNVNNTQGFQYFWANPTQDQMLSRRDFADLVAHYRLRGANSFALLNSGNTNVTDAQLREDAVAGWTEPTINAILSAGDAKTLASNNTSYPTGGPFGSMSKIISDGSVMDVEKAGAILSGAYSLDLEELVILISNMDDAQHTITVPEQIAGYSLSVKDFTLAPGSHLLAEYSLEMNGKKKGWEIAAMHVPFTAIANSRNGFGIPEPGTLSLLVIGAIIGLNRRSRGENLVVKA